VNDATITPIDNGPYLVQGNVTLLDAEGNPYEVNARTDRAFRLFALMDVATGLVAISLAPLVGAE